MKQNPYILQGDEITTLYVTGKETVLSLHDYYNNFSLITEVSQHFGDLVNISVKYYNNSFSPLKGATLTYEWLGLDPIQFYEDPMNDEYYTTIINTSLAGSKGPQTIKVVALIENYITQTLYTTIMIDPRPTKLNGYTDHVYINSKVWVKDPNPFIFTYTDTTSTEKITNASSTSYTWEELFEKWYPCPNHFPQ